MHATSAHAQQAYPLTRTPRIALQVVRTLFGFYLRECMGRCFSPWRNLSLRRGISVLIGGAFEWLFCPKGREFEQANLQKFKCPGVAPYWLQPCLGQDLISHLLLSIWVCFCFVLIFFSLPSPLALTVVTCKLFYNLLHHQIKLENTYKWRGFYWIGCFILVAYLL